MGQIRKRGGVYWIRWYRDGRRYRGKREDRQVGEARDLLRQREGDVSKGAPLSAKIGRLRFEEAAKDLLTDYLINGKRSHDNLKNDGHRGRARAVVPRPAAGEPHHGRHRAYVAIGWSRATRTPRSTANSPR